MTSNGRSTSSTLALTTQIPAGFCDFQYRMFPLRPVNSSMKKLLTVCRAILLTESPKVETLALTVRRTTRPNAVVSANEQFLFVQLLVPPGAKTSVRPPPTVDETLATVNQ